jgi:protein-L-isoaspartate O-methyltransferase
VEEVPYEWREQLKIGGRLLYPKLGALFLEEKLEEEQFRVHEYRGYDFVPFIP